jgi:ribosomal protein L11 methyltransferase
VTGGDPARPGPDDSPTPVGAPSPTGERRPLSPRTFAIVALVALAATALADSALAAQNFTLALIYIPPLLALAWLAGWRFAAACTLLAAVTNFTVDVWAGGTANTLLVHAGNLALFILCVPAERGVATVRFMLEYTQRGDAWKAAIHPARIGERVVLVPVWRREEAAAVTAQPNDVQVLLDPGQAFGTGSHPTTVLCVGLLEQFVKPGDRLLDLGCGTGILSLAALKLGAATALAADIQSESVQATLANARLNDLAGRIEVRLGSLQEVVGPLLEHGDERFNLTVSNILPDVIAAGLKAGMGQTLAPGGVLIVSGFKPEHEPRMRTYLDEAGLHVIERREKDDWLALASQRKPA